MQGDPIGLIGGINLYLYAEDNALIYIDPYGLWRWGDPFDQRIVDAVAGFGDGASLGISRLLRYSANIDGGIDKCSYYYRGSRWAGYALALGIYANFRVPTNLTHFTSAENAVKIVFGSMHPGGGLFGPGVYAAKIGRPLNPFVPKTSLTPIPVTGKFIRIVPGLVYLKEGDWLYLTVWTAATSFIMSEGPGAIKNLFFDEGCGC